MHTYTHTHTHTQILTKNLLVEQTRKMDSNEFNFFFANKLQQLRIFLSQFKETATILVMITIMQARDQ